MLDKSRVALVCIVGMFGGFLFSRVALSISMFLFGVNAIRDVPPRQWLKQKWWLLGLAWVGMYALSWFWSDDKGEWGNHLQTKLPFLLLPLAFSYQPRFSERHLHALTVSMAAMLLYSAIYSVSFFLTDPEHYTREYHVSHMLPTLPKRDHIRCSLSMAFFVIWCVYVWPQLRGRAVRWFIGVTVVILIAYLHVLAAKSGLVSLYFFIVVWGFYMALAKRKLVGVIIIAAIPLLVVLAMKLVPTFRERVHYIDFTYVKMKEGDRSGTVGDLGRLLSYKLAAELIEESPLLGRGTGDMKHDMDTLYARKYPQIPETGRLLPHNQALTVAIGCGVPAMLLFLIWVFAPLARLRRDRQSFFFFIVWLLLLLQLMIEPVLEVQFGVFVWLFFLLLFMGEVRRDPPAAVAN